MTACYTFLYNLFILSRRQQTTNTNQGGNTMHKDKSEQMQAYLFTDSQGKYKDALICTEAEAMLHADLYGYFYKVTDTRAIYTRVRQAA